MGQSIKLTFENDLAFLEFDQPDSKVNVLTTPVLQEFHEIIRSLNQRPDLKGLLISSAKPDIFIAGADIKEIERITLEQDGAEKARAGQQVYNLLEKLPFPTMALINGACLGGGLELALACDWRLAGFGEKTKIGLPEVNLGVLPGFGGTIRLPRLTGLQKGLELIVSAKLLSPEAALRAGLVDGVVSVKLLREEGISFIRAKGKKRKKFKPPVKGLLNLLLDRTFIGRAIMLSLTKRSVFAATRGQYPAALLAAEVIAKNYASSLKAALEREAKAFGRLVITDISKNLVSLFFLSEKYKKEKWVEASPATVKKCAVLGAGVMGGGIAQLFSSYRIPVRMKDVNWTALGSGLSAAKKVYDGALKRRKIKPAQAMTGLALISPTLDYSGFANADLVVEAIVEDLAVKQSVFSEVSRIVKPGAILASNTSCLPIGAIASGTKDPSRVVGLHFFNPVHRMPLIEVIRSSQTSPEVVATMVDISRKLGKTPIVVKDSWGFLVNRLLITSLLEAADLLAEGVSFETIDKALLDFGLPMGAFWLLDEIGLDVGYKVAHLLEENLGKRMKVNAILKQVYEKKWLGKKVGKGFYLHKGKERKPNQEIYQLLQKKNLTLPDSEIVKRSIYRMLAEAVLCLDENVVRNAGDVDIGMIMGAGFPPFRGGLLRFGDTLDRAKLANELRALSDKMGAEKFEAFRPLLEFAKAGKKFYQE
jgi:3-hydroxyacyl-CoA dehydrogenase/enoyl-CoA hydratase/3-hydroxybutyryl-CoA epimerase